MHRINLNCSIFTSVPETPKKLPVFVFILLHFAFLLAAVFENMNSKLSIFILISVALLLGFFYSRNIHETKETLRKRDILSILFTALGAVITYFLNVQTELGIVLSAALVGLFSSFIPNFDRGNSILEELPGAMYCGAFAGMTAPFVAQGYAFIFFSGILAGIFLIISRNTLVGHGGKLGSIAFGGVSIVSLILFIIS